MPKITINNDDTTKISAFGVNFDRDNSPSFSGSVTGGTPGQIVQIRDSLSVVGTATVGANGSWSYDFGAAGKTLTDGAHNINVRLASNASVTASYKVTIDTQTTTPTAFASPAETYVDIGGVTHIVTNTTFPVISGRGEAGATIDLFNRNVPDNSDPSLPADQQFMYIGSATVGADGNYKYELQVLNDDGSIDKGASLSLFPDGTYNIGITATDIAGNFKSAAPVVLEVDTVVANPVVYSLDTMPGISDGAAKVNGVVYTNDGTPSIKGYAETGSEVTITDAAGNFLGTAMATGAVVAGQSGQSTFTFEVDNAHTLGQGLHTFNFITTDRAGNVSDPTPQVIGVDSETTAPTVSMADAVSSGSVKYTNDNTPTISGYAEAGAAVEFKDQAGNTLGSVTANATTGAYSFTPNTAMADGATTITAKSTDALGNSASTTYNVTIDTQIAAPTLSAGSSPLTVGGVTYNNDSTPTITGTAEAGSTVTVTDGTTELGTTVAGADGTYSFTAPNAMSDGGHTLSVSAKDIAGNVSATATQTVTIDSRAPNAPSESVAVSSTLTVHGVTYDTDRTPTISGTAEAGSTVTIKDGETVLGSVKADELGAYTFTVADANQLSGGAHSFSVTATDLAGNTSSASPAQTRNVVCYMSGTRLQTQDGWKLVEQLKVGDLLKTVSGQLQPVTWLGNTTIDCRRQQNKQHAYPVRIAQHAFGHQLPERDLFVSPLHSIYVEGVMIPAIHLVNGVTVTQEQQEGLVTYHHVELPQHDVVFAEGLPAETYLDTSAENRHFFSKNNGDQKVFEMNLQFPACPEGTPVWQHIWNTQGYAPLTQSGPILEAVKVSLMQRALLVQEGQRLTA